MADEKPDSTKPKELTHEALHQWAVTLKEDGEGRRNPLEGQWWENLATYMGDFWAEWDPHKRRLWEPVRKPDSRVRVPINLAQPAVRTELAKLTKNRPIADVLAAGADTKSVNSAKVGDKILNKYAERKFSLPRVRRRGLEWATICGSGAYFVDYDETLEDPIEVYEIDGKPVFDQRVIKAYKQRDKKKKKSKLGKSEIKQGELVIKALSPMQLIYDFSVTALEDAWWLIVTDVEDIELAERRWGKRPSESEEVAPGVIEKRLLQRMDTTKSLIPQNPKAQKLSKIHRLFVKKGHPWFPEGAHIVFTDDKILKAENFPFRHGRLPVVMMGHIPNPTGQFDTSVLEQIKGPVVELSKTESQMLENRNMATNPIWLIPEQTRVEEDAIQNKPGHRVPYNHVPNVPPPQPVQMPDLPQYVKDLPELLERHIQSISGQGETAQGRVPPGARSGVAIAYLQEEDDTKLGPTVQEFEECIEVMSELILETIAEKYNITRTVTIYPKRGGEPDVFDFYGEMLSGCAGVEVQAGSALPRSKAARQQFILDLWDRKLEQDPRKVRDMLELSEGEPDEWDIDIDQAERENRRMEKGKPAVVEEFHNHPAHLYQHHRTMKTAEYEEWDEAKQELFKEHCKEHEEAVRGQQEELAMKQQSAEGGTPVQAGANGQQRPEGPPAQFAPAESARGPMDDIPQ